MKTNHTNEQLQAAIDAACKEIAKTHPAMGGSITLMSDHNESTRLHLIKTALDLLPEPPPPVVDGKTPGQVAFEAAGLALVSKWESCQNKDRWHRVATAILAAFGGPDAVDWKAKYDELEKAYAEHAEVTQALHAKAEKAESKLANFVEAANEETRKELIERARLLRKIEELAAKPQLANAKAHEEFQAELDAVWNEEPWTPKVGDVVRLKSGGPKMTISAVGRVEVQVHGFKGESLVHSFLPTATLQPA